MEKITHKGNFHIAEERINRMRQNPNLVGLVKGEDPVVSIFYLRPDDDATNFLGKIKTVPDGAKKAASEFGCGKFTFSECAWVYNCNTGYTWPVDMQQMEEADLYFKEM